MNKKQILWGIIVVSLFGVFDAGYLTYEHYAGGVPPCTINGCEVVLTSPYATIFGFPMSLLGVVFYCSVFVVALILRKRESHLVKVFLLSLTGSGFIFSLYLFYLQAQVLSAFCQYCLISFFFSTTLFAGVVFHFLKKDTDIFVLN